MIRVCLLLLMVTFFGCGARGEVAKEKFFAKIDALIGESEVKRKQIEGGIANGEKSLQPLAEGKVRAQVESDQMQRKMDDVQSKIADAEASLKALKDYLAENNPIELAGKTYTVADLNVQAKKVIDAHKTLSTELATMKQSHQRLLEQAQTFEKRHDDAKRQIATLKSQVKQIDINIVSLNSMKKARQAAGDGGITLAENFDKLQSEINSLDATIQTELGVEDEKWQEVSAANDVDDVSHFINTTKGAEDTLSEISQILGQSN